MEDIIIKDKDAITMKLLHFFITEEGYTPIIVHGVQNEIWLEKMDAPYSIVRIMSGHIHNREQLEFDLYKAQSLVKRIKRKTFKFRVKALSIFLDVEDNVELNCENDIECINIVNEEDLEKSDVLKETFPNISSKLKHEEEGLALFAKITEDINKKTEKEAKKTEEVFKINKPYVTIALIGINVLVYLLSLILGPDYVGTIGGLNPDLVRSGDYYRLISAVFVHLNFMHVFLNMYALYIIGYQLESFFGSFKYLIIYLFSGIMGSLLSMTFLASDAWSIGASGAIFGLLGALLYFGYHYRVYLGNTLRSQILPVIFINLMIGFIIPGIDQFAHIGGLFGGVLMAMTVGLKYKTSKTDQINGAIVSLLAVLFLIYIAFFR